MHKTPVPCSEYFARSFEILCYCTVFALSAIFPAFYFFAITILLLSAATTIKASVLLL